MTIISSHLLTSPHIFSHILTTQHIHSICQHHNAFSQGMSHKATSPQVVCERLHAMQLCWGDEAHILSAKNAHAPRGFDVVYGADLLYQQGALPLLFATCVALLASKGVVLLACKERNGIGVAAYTAAAHDAGLVVLRMTRQDDVAVLVLCCCASDKGTL